jgi:nucleoside-diphosphate-sugar epimerase
MSRKVAVVAGASGVVGRGMAELLAGDPEWDVVALARKPVDIPGTRFVAVDLTDADQCRERLSTLRDATHVFYAARFDHRAGTPEPIETNAAMLRHLVDAIEPVATGLRHIHLVHGTKWYGSTLGPFPTPAREDDPRSLGSNFYYAQQDFIAQRQKGRAWTWSASRPHGICHAVPDSPRSLVLVVAVYALICRELGLPLCFPGTPENYDAIYQCTSSDHLAHAMRFMAMEPACANEAFNATNGDYIRWSQIWPLFADYFGMKTGPVRTVRLAEVMADKGPVWDGIAARHGLASPPYERLVLWGYGDFVFTPGWDMMSDTTKLRMSGFGRAVRTSDEFVRLFEHLRAAKVLP